MTDLSIDVKDLYEKLMMLKKGFSASSRNTFVDTLKVTGRADHVVLEHTNGEYVIEARVKGSGQGTCALVNMFDLHQLTSKLKKKGGEISLFFENDSEVANAVHPNISMDFEAAEKPVFDPVLPELSTQGDWKGTDFKAFQSALEKSIPYISGDDFRHEWILGANFIEREGSLYVLATDGHRLINWYAAEAGTFDVKFIPREIAKKIVYIGTKSKGTKEVRSMTVSEGEKNYVAIEVGDYTVSYGLEDWPEPIDYRRMTPPNSQFSMYRFNRKEMAESLDIMPFQEQWVRLCTDPFSLHSNCPKNIVSPLKDAEMVSKGDLYKSNLHVNVNHFYLDQALKGLESDHITVSMVDTLSPVILREVEPAFGEAKDNLVLVMPCRD